jgi:uncharacterized protein (TIGR04255 family)
VPRTLKKKPLKEALLEVRWLKEPSGDGPEPRDRHYPLFLGRLQERLSTGFPFPEPLPAAELPDNVGAFIVRYRFRPSAEGWPVIQVGPGIATLNFTEAYDWETFLRYSRDFFSNIAETYSAVAKAPPEFSSIILRFINAFPFSFEEENAFEFLRTKLNTGVKLPDGVAQSPQARRNPAEIQIAANFPLLKQAGSATLHIGSGKTDGQPAIILDLRAIVKGGGTPQTAETSIVWISEAHDLIENWFFSLIEGDLYTAFGGDLK